jgi:hypothetical protein
MKNREQCASMNAQKPRRHFTAHSAGLGVGTLLVLLASGCATEAEFLAKNAPAAQNTALTRGRFELNCPQATAAVLSQKVTYINGIAAGGYEWTEYTIGVRGCNKQTVYMVACRDQNNCNAFSQNTNVLENVQGR